MSQDKCRICNDWWAHEQLDGRCPRCFNKQQKEVKRTGPYQAEYPMARGQFFSEEFDIVKDKFDLERENFGQ